MIIFWSSVHAYGQRNEFTISVSPIKESRTFSCAKFYGDKSIGLRIELMQERNGVVYKTKRILKTYQKPEFLSDLVDKVLAQWGQVGYTNSQNLELLKKRDSNLPLDSSSYFFSLEKSIGLAAIRLFNGTHSLTPIEISNPGLILPFRDHRIPIFELGLVTSDSKFDGGTAYLFKQISEYLKNERNTLRKRGVVVIQTRPHQVSLFQQYGFTFDSNLPNGLVLMSVNINKFIRINKNNPYALRIKPEYATPTPDIFLDRRIVIDMGASLINKHIKTNNEFGSLSELLEAVDNAMNEYFEKRGLPVNYK